MRNHVLLILSIMYVISGASSAYCSSLNSVEGADKLVVVLADTWNSHKAEMLLLDKSSGEWSTSSRFKAVVGRKGLGWGVGVQHGRDNEPVKKEGDKKAPAGIFPLSLAMGYSETPPSEAGLSYRQILPTTHCVDDKASEYYNRIVDTDELKLGSEVPWKSSEKMKRKDILYKWLVVVDYNSPDPVPGDGSCIFIHVWRSQENGTAGCTAISEEDIVSLLRWLDPEKKRLMVQLPRSEYKAYQNRWSLPDIE